MFNGVGLTTPRGSGTSGYVQKSLAFYKQREKNSSYREVLNKFKENPAPERSSINENIIKHDVLYKIEAEIYKLKKQHEKEYNDSQMKTFLSRKRKELEDEYSRKVIGEDDEDNRENNKQPKHINSHKFNYLIEKKNEKLKNAFGIKDSHVPGEAFDIELQEEKRKEEKIVKKKEKKEKEKERKKKLKQQEREEKRLQRKAKELKLLRELEEQYPELMDV